MTFKWPLVSQPFGMAIMFDCLRQSPPVYWSLSYGWWRTEREIRGWGSVSSKVEVTTIIMADPTMRNKPVSCSYHFCSCCVHCTFLKHNYTVIKLLQGKSIQIKGGKAKTSLAYFLFPQFLSSYSIESWKFLSLPHIIPGNYEG